MTEINLDNPGRVWANAVNGKEMQFLIVADKAEFTKEAFEENPDCASGDDLFFKSDPVPNDNGQSILDLGPKKDELKEKITEREVKARVVAISTPTDKTEEPDKKLASVQEVTLLNPVSICVHPIRPIAQTKDWVAYHHPICFVQFETRGEALKEVEITWGKIENKYPMFSLWKPETSGQAKAKEMVFGSVGDPHDSSRKCPHPDNLHRSGWWSDSNKAPWQGNLDPLGGYARKIPVEPDTPYVIGIYPRGTGLTVLEIKGMDEFSDVSAKVTVGMGSCHPHPGD